VPSPLLPLNAPKTNNIPTSVTAGTRIVSSTFKAEEASICGTSTVRPFRVFKSTVGISMEGSEKSFREFKSTDGISMEGSDKSFG
jgi:hypothetical protein